MKTLKFAPHLIPQIISGEKTSTWRLFDDKELSIGDEIEFRNTEDNSIIGHGQIISLTEKPIKDINESDYHGHEKFKDTRDIIENFKKYYSHVEEDSLVKILHFTFKKA